MSTKIWVGFRLKPVSEEVLLALEPEFRAPSTWKDEEKIAADVAQKRAAYRVEAAQQPYTATFDEVYLIDTRGKRGEGWTSKDRGPGGPKPPVCVAVRSWLLGRNGYAHAWQDPPPPKPGEPPPPARKRPEVVFVGFNVRLFLKVLGLECSMPAVGKPLPPRMWYGTADHRDIAEAVCPKEYRLDLLNVIRARRPPPGEAQNKWDKILEGWTGPHVHPQKDSLLACELATQLGLVDE
jgi:hypothetical protein